MKRVHVVANSYRPDALHAGKALGASLAAQGYALTTEEELSGPLGIDQGRVEGVDLIVAFGGDGTLIRAAHLAGDRATPILGVYHGRFGFVTEFSGEVTPVVEAFFRGDVHVEPRMMLQAELMRRSQPVAALHALNEIVLQRSVTGRMMHFSVEVDDVPITKYPADGVLVSSPTGSTAYNLSAGGPIMHPNVRAIAISAIAPHTLGSRTIVLHEDSRVCLNLETRGDAILSADGQTKMHLLPRDALVITKSPRVTNLVTQNGQDFLHKLHKQLLWSAGIPDEDAR